MEIRIQKAIKRGIDFLAKSQLDSGAFKTTRSRNWNMIPCDAFESVFLHSFVVTILQRLIPDSAVVKHSCEFIISQRELDWTWRFFGPGTHLLPDWDDTACCLVALDDEVAGVL